MKRATFMILAGMLLTTAYASGQGRVSVHQQTFAHVGDSVLIEMDVDLNRAKVSNRSFVLLTPALKSGSVSIDMPSIMINGHNRHKAYKRLIVLSRELSNVNLAINASDKKAPRTYSYVASVPFEEWMSTAEFALREDQCECNGSIVPMSFEVVSRTMENRNKPITPPERIVDMNFTASFKVPNPEAVKTRTETGKAYLDFAVGRAEIRADYKDNALELEKIGHLVRNIKNNQYATITGIVIEGFASPDGAYASNMSLSSRRATALKEFIKRNYGLRESLFKVTGRGEDWNTLDSLVSESNMPHKDEILNIIRGTDIFDGREKKLMILHGGVSYRQMKEELFPRLRRSDYELHYTIIPFTVEKGKEVIKTAPENLSLNEMFLIAQTYRAGTLEYNEIFEIAAKTYPYSNVSNLNAAATALSDLNYETAGKYLSKVTLHDGAWHNNMGVMYAAQGNYAYANEHFRKSADMGSAEAVGNLEQMQELDINKTTK